MVQYFPIVTGSLTVTGSVLVSGSITTNSTITATTLVVQTITSSISAITGSTNFGSLSSNTHTFTGSVNISSSLTVASGSTTPTLTIAGGLVGIGMNPVYKLDVGDAIRGLDILAGGNTFAYDGTIRARNASNSTNVLLHSNGSSYFLGGNVGIGTSTPGDILDVQKNQNATTNFYLRNTNTTDSNSRAYLNIISGTTTLQLKAITGDHVYVAPTTAVNTYLGYNNVVNITSGGDVNIGNAGSFNLHNGYFRLRNSAGSATYGLFIQKATWLGSGTDYSPSIAAETGYGISFFTNGTGTERMAITSAGVIQLGNASYSPYLQFRTGGGTTYAGVINMDSKNDYLHINGGSTTGYGSGANISLIGSDRYGTNTAGQLELAAGNASSNTSYGYIAFYTANTTRMQISYNGAIGTTAGGTNIYNPSDIRLKKNIIEVPYGLNEILSLKPSKFNWRDGFSESEADKDMLGFIAQEIQTVIPEAVESFGQTVHVNEDNIEYTVENPLRVNEKFIIPVLVKALQELNTKFEDYKATHP